MPYRVTMELDAFNGTRDAEESVEQLAAMLDCLIQINTIFYVRRLRAGIQIPLLYQSGVRYEEEPTGAEFWRDIPTVLKYGTGDCLPLSTGVVTETGDVIPLGALKTGDRIMGDGGTTIVKEVAATGVKPVVAVTLDDGSILRASPSHRVFDGSVLRDVERRVEDLRASDLIRIRRASGRSSIAEVVATHEEPPEMMGDITTDSGRFIHADTGAVVHNCEDLSCWLVVEKRVRFNIPAKPLIFPQLQKRANGQDRYLYHVAVATPDAPNGWDDPSRRLGMPG